MLDIWFLVLILVLLIILGYLLFKTYDIKFEFRLDGLYILWTKEVWNKHTGEFFVITTTKRLLKIN